ncbi:MAG: phosphatidate cytidylyltransferase [Firmicutes bacterium]|nr:phosphatidate cytidylyltransferase [Bacillota bacterium]
MKTRIITAAICIPVFLFVIIMGGWWLGIPVAILAALSCLEYVRLVNKIQTKEKLAWLLLGCAYILLGFLSLLGLRLSHESFLLPFWLLMCIWITDSAAYFVGRVYGRHKMAPEISPNKSWEGAIAGGLAGMLLPGAFFSIAFNVNFFLALLISLLVSSIGQIGDLVESKVKRLANVKDSGTLFPGHGGVLDRFDSIMLSAPFAYILSLLLIGK